jgi:hypothetical protein
MPGAIDRFGLIPKMAFSETQLEAIPLTDSMQQVQKIQIRLLATKPMSSGEFG